MNWHCLETVDLDLANSEDFSQDKYLQCSFHFDSVVETGLSAR